MAAGNGVPCGNVGRYKQGHLSTKMVRSAFRATAIFNNLMQPYFVRGGCSRKAVTTVTRIMEPRCNVPPGLFLGGLLVSGEVLVQPRH